MRRKRRNPPYKVSPQDHSRGRGGFEGEYFTVKGVTDREFATKTDIANAVKRRLRGWVHTTIGSNEVFKHPRKPKYLVIYDTYRNPTRKRLHRLASKRRRNPLTRGESARLIWWGRWLRSALRVKGSKRMIAPLERAFQKGEAAEAIRIARDYGKAGMKRRGARRYSARLGRYVKRRSRR